MLNAYGRYKKARDASWQALIDNKVDSLPVDVVRVANDNGITLLKNSAVNELRKGESGISIYDGSEWFIVYDDTANPGRKRFTVAHELWHIFFRTPDYCGIPCAGGAGDSPSNGKRSEYICKPLFSSGVCPLGAESPNRCRHCAGV